MVDRQQIEDFIYREARLQDEHKYDEWEALWTDDAIYWVPADESQDNPENCISYIYDHRARLANRVGQLKTGARHAQVPPSRLCRVVSGVQIENGGGSGWTVFSSFVLVETRLQQSTVWAGRNTHRLREVDGVLKMAFKKVELVNRDQDIPTLAFLI